ncbi:N-6 DNA methylase [Streptomyces sp. NPDC085540]|uniref:N-6 DNA methylase n=1 Tax=Streptomyces sp. NPDC085540 TaxID=3365730 RepID=UPI0037D75761
MKEESAPRRSLRHTASSTQHALTEVSELTTGLSRLMNRHDAARLVLGLLYLSRTAHTGSPVSPVPTWSWLLRQAAKEGPITGAVSRCLGHWLTLLDAEGSGAGSRDAMPFLPPNIDVPLRRLIQAIDAAQQVGDLLDQCLQNLSTAHARGSQYFTPRDVARLVIGAAAPRDGHRVLDPVCGSGGLLVESHRYVRASVGLNPTMSLLGKEQHAHTSQVARMNLAVRGIEARILPPGDSLAVPEAEAFYDIVLANLPFNQPTWAAEDRAVRPSVDPRWPDGPPPKGSANSAWILHIAHALAPRGRAAFLMADIAAKSRQPAARKLREQLVRDDFVECVIALPPRVFGHSDATACLWVLNRDKSARSGWGTIDRRGEVLFINARRAFELIPDSRARRLGDRHSDRILTTLARWRGTVEENSADMPQHDEADWCRSCPTEEIARRSYDLMPTTYAATPPGPEESTRSRIDELKRELAEKLGQVHALEPRLLEALEEI